MKYDKKITTLIKEVNDACETYLGYAYSANLCAMTDRIIESIVNKSKEIDKLHEHRCAIKDKKKKNTYELEELEQEK